MAKYKIQTPTPYLKLGSYLAAKREKSGMTQREVSLELGYSAAQFISNFERGVAAVPLKRLKQLTKMMDLNEDDLIELTIDGYKNILKVELRS
jgi:transcriptional regulator with XRE-family HTH domain